MNYKHFKKMKLFITFPLLILIGVGCDREGVQGVVVDPFGNAIDSVSVEVEEGTFTAMTNSAGEYLIAYSPGTFTLNFSKPGYIPQTLNLRLQEGTLFPGGPMVLFPDPIVEVEIEITSLNPTSGSPGTDVVVNGKNFDEKLNLFIRLRSADSGTDIPVQTEFLNSSQLSFKVPPNAACDAYLVTVFGTALSPGIFLTSNSLPYTVTGSCLPIPVITNLIPSDGLPGTVVMVNGNNFSEGSGVVFQQSIFPFSKLPVTTTFVSNFQLRFTVPAGTPCNSYGVRIKVPEIIQESENQTFRVTCPTSTNWQIRLERLHVNLAQERGLFEDGDEPYFVVIGFRSRAGIPGSTSAFWSEFLDDDWAEGIDTGEDQDIPQQMGVVSFPAVTMAAELNLLTPDESIVGTELVGAVVVAFESDLTPFGLIHDLMNDVRDQLEQEIRNLIEQGGIILCGDNVQACVQQALGNIISAAEVGYLDIALAFANNDDELLGYHFFLFGAAHQVQGFPSFPGATTGALTEREFLLPIIGENALYNVTGSVTWSGLTIDPVLVVGKQVAQ